MAFVKSPIESQQILNPRSKNPRSKNPKSKNKKATNPKSKNPKSKVNKSKIQNRKSKITKVVPWGIEPQSQVPETCILSVVLQDQFNIHEDNSNLFPFRGQGWYVNHENNLCQLHSLLPSRKD